MALQQLAAGWAAWAAQRLWLGGLGARLAACAGVAGGAIVLAAAALRQAAAGATPTPSWPAALFKAYSVLFRAPGAHITGESTLAASLVLHALFLFSLLVFAVLLAALTDALRQALAALRGHVRLPLRGHVLVLAPALSWTRAAPSLLRALGRAQADPRSRLWRRPVVLLAEQGDVDAAVAWLSRSRMQLFCRAGCPARPCDLAAVTAAAADTVIVLQPDGGGAAAEAAVASTVVGLAVARRAAAPAVSCGRCASLWPFVRRERTSAPDGGARIVVQASSGGRAGHDGDEGVLGFLQAAIAAGCGHSGRVQVARVLSPVMLGT